MRKLLMMTLSVSFTLLPLTFAYGETGDANYGSQKEYVDSVVNTIKNKQLPETHKRMIAPYMNLKSVPDHDTRRGGNIYSRQPQRGGRDIYQHDQRTQARPVAQQPQTTTPLPPPPAAEQQQEPASTISTPTGFSNDNNSDGSGWHY